MYSEAGGVPDGEEHCVLSAEVVGSIPTTSIMEKPPQSAADPRDGEPYYIDSECDCGEELVLYDELSDKKKRQSDALSDPELEPDNDEIWHDERVCPECLDGIHMDWPDKMLKKLRSRIENKNEADGSGDIEELKELLEEEKE